MFELISIRLEFPNFEFFITCLYKPPRSRIQNVNKTFFRDRFPNFSVGANITLSRDVNINLFNSLQFPRFE